MPKGLFTQTLVVLLRKNLDIDEIKPLLEGHRLVNESREIEEWAIGGPSLTLDYLPELHGYVAIDIVDQRWPDDMGNPQDDAILFCAWSMGHFGPFAYPYGLARASELCWRWEAAPEAVKMHEAFMRIRLSYVFGGDDDAETIPEGCDPLDELQFLTALLEQLLGHPDAICYFNPGGEVLMPRDHLRESIDYHKQYSLPPLDAWVNTRLCRLDDTWALMDSVGNQQFDVPDLEVVFSHEDLDPQEIETFIRNTTYGLLTKKVAIADGDTMDGPGGAIWKATALEDGFADPPRDLLRWLPADCTEPPAALIRTSDDQ